MSSGMEPQKQSKPLTKVSNVGPQDDMPDISSQVTFDPSGGATINIGEVDDTVTQITVSWGGTQVYSSTTPNAAAQSNINGGSTVTGSTYVLTVSIWYSGWSRPSIYTATYTARPNSNPSQSLARTQVGGV